MWRSTPKSHVEKCWSGNSHCLECDPESLSHERPKTGRPRGAVPGLRCAAAHVTCTYPSWYRSRRSPWQRPCHSLRNCAIEPASTPPQEQINLQPVDCKRLYVARGSERRTSKRNVRPVDKSSVIRGSFEVR